MRTGFYEELDAINRDIDEELDEKVTTFGFIENDYCGNLYNFLHGSCTVFAQVLHERFGYPIEALYEYGELIHMYCLSPDGTSFVDVRGVTDDWDEFIAEYVDNGLMENSDHTICSRYDDIKEVPRRFREFDHEKIEFANKVIDAYPSYYNLELQKEQDEFDER